MPILAMKYLRYIKSYINGFIKRFSIKHNLTISIETCSSDAQLYSYFRPNFSFFQKSTSQAQSSSEALNSKRYLILTYSVEFDRIHYPLPLPYLGKPNPVALLRVSTMMTEIILSCGRRLNHPLPQMIAYVT